MRVGIFGGTFNPPHIGHINMCKLFLEELSLDKLFVIPASIPPHKQIKSKTTTQERLEMAEIAFSNLSCKIEVSDLETKRSGKSYTADTIKELKSQGYDDLYLLCGTDMILTLDGWYNPEYIFENATIVYMRRENEEENNHLLKEKIAFYEKSFNAKIVNIQAKPIELSSSTVRETVKSGNDASKMVTSEVLQFIKLKNLYRDE